MLSDRITVIDAGARAVLTDLNSRYGRSRRQPALTTSTNVRSPLAFGWRRPEICLPADALDGLTADERRCMLAHEFAHLQSRDPLWLLGYRWCAWLAFFQPLHRIVLGRLRDLAEYRCDDFALRSGCEGTALASTLLKIAGWQQVAPPAAEHAMASTRSPLARRVQRALQRNPMTPAGPRGATAMALFALTGIGWGTPAVEVNTRTELSTFAIAPAPTEPDIALEQLHRQLARILASTPEQDMDEETRILLGAIRTKLAQVDSLYQTLRALEPNDGAGTDNPIR